MKKTETESYTANGVGGQTWLGLRLGTLLLVASMAKDGNATAVHHTLAVRGK
jgi:hypothetical protein